MFDFNINLSTILLIVVVVVIAAQAAWTVAQKRGGMPHDWSQLFEDVRYIARGAVAAAMQYKDKDNAAKKQYVKDVIDAFLTHRGLSVPEPLIDSAIESAVYWLNQQTQRTATNATDQSQSRIESTER